jgi:hypothetical protein
MAQRAIDSDLSEDVESILNIAKDDSSSQNTTFDPERQADWEKVHKALKKAKRDSSSEIPALDPEKQAAVEDMRTDTSLKKLYAYWFIGILIGQLVALNTVFIAIGLEKLKYSDFVINLFMGGTLAEVFGVVLVITKYLFSRK